MVLYLGFYILYILDGKACFYWISCVFSGSSSFSSHDDVEEVLEESDEEGSEGSIGDCRSSSGSGIK